MGKMFHSKKGFTIVELVIVIAVVAILAAVLIPTFSSIIETAKLSNDRNFVTQANKVLLYNCLTSKNEISYEKAKALLKNSGYDIPCKPETSGLKFYWTQSENKVLLVVDEAKSAVYPDDFAGVTVDSSWIDLSTEKAYTPETYTEEQGEQSEEETQEQSEEKPNDKPQKEQSNGFFKWIESMFKRWFGW